MPAINRPPKDGSGKAKLYWAQVAFGLTWLLTVSAIFGHGLGGKLVAATPLVALLFEALLRRYVKHRRGSESSND